MLTFILCLTIAAMYQAAGETEILLKRPSDGVLWSWHPTKTSLSGAGWNFLSSQTYSVCDITIPTEPTNWLRTDFIDVKDAKMLNIKLKYNLRRCPPPPTASSFCKHKWSIYVLHVEKEVVGVDLNPVTANEVTYQKVTTIEPTVMPAHEKVEQYDYDVKIITKKGGVYLAFLDQGACVSISSVTVSYNYCPEIGSVLVRFSRTSAPVNDSYVKEQTGRCTDVNSINKVKLSGVCLSNGEWNITDGIKCLCKPGHELVIGSEGNVPECSACLTGFYKSVASNSKCNECPTNSASNTGRTGCSCHEGFYKKPGLHVAPCKALPKAPRNAHLDVVKATYAKIKWERSPDDIDGLKLRYSLDCFRCNSSKYKDCKESCGPSVEYEPNKDNITNGTVTIIGLLSDSFLKFRVYSVSELNEQEKDRDKWNYVTVSTKTKAEDVPAVEGSSSKTKMVIARSAGGGGLLLLILAITIIIVVVRFKRSRRNKKEDHITPEKASGTAKEKQDMIAELNVMKRLKPHHVLKLIGCCSISGPIQIVVGYLPYGDLLGYLRKSGGYSDSYNTGEKKPASKLTAKDHLSFAWMIADGMQYLATIKVIHRDLAARNILVGENQVCKISDFGLALDVNDDIYVSTSQARLPVKWMPPESLFHSESSTMSEVWSYGIVLLKIFTIGDSPYPRGFNDTQTVSMLERGYRMQRPIHISEELFSIMSECWSEKPEERPTFKWICSADNRLIKDTKTCIDLDGYNDADYVNFDMAEGVQ